MSVDHSIIQGTPIEKGRIEAATRALKKFRIGASIIGAIPLLFAFAQVLGGDDNRTAGIYGLMSTTLIMTVVWAVHCAEGFLKSMATARSGSASSGV